MQGPEGQQAQQRLSVKIGKILWVLGHWAWALWWAGVRAANSPGTAQVAERKVRPPAPKPLSHVLALGCGTTFCLSLLTDDQEERER